MLSFASMPKTINPANEEVLENYEYISRNELEEKITRAHTTFRSWKETPFSERKRLFKRLAEIMLEQKEELAKLDTIEMGMLFSGALGDVSKTAAGINYVADHFEEWIAPIEFDEGGLKGKRVFEPMGVIYTVSPWNFPYNQVFRNAAPNILAGNVVLSKHASNVPQCARKIEELFMLAGFPVGVYQNLEISAGESEYIIAHPLVRGTNITGGDRAGRTIGALAGQNLKPSILELGGNDPFIVIDTDDIDATVKLATTGRLSSCGQKCNSSKRMIVVAEYYDEFCEKLAASFKSLKIGDPFEDTTEVGPLAKEEGISDLETMISKAVDAGATLLTGGKRLDMPGYYFEPTVVKDVLPGMSFDEEPFGPVAPVFKAKDKAHAIELANNSRFGLTACVVTTKREVFEEVATKLETGNTFWNKIPTSYPFLPYGGVKDSGYGKELGERGIKNFMNEKVVVY